MKKTVENHINQFFEYFEGVRTDVMNVSYVTHYRVCKAILLIQL